MKKIFSLLMILAVLAACKKNEETVTATQVETETSVAADTMSTSAPQGDMVYACSMHPEVTGAKGDNCPKCGMALTEEVSP